MVKLTVLTEHLNALLRPELYSDAAMNGLQVEAPRDEVSRVAVAVDSGTAVIEAAIERGAELLIVHHGFFWGSALPITGALARKLQLLLKNGCSLYASHLPLDGNEAVGNAFELARSLGWTDIRPAFEYKGTTVGARVDFDQPMSMSELTELCRPLAQGPFLSLSHGPELVRSVGVVTGSGGDMLEYCRKTGIDLIITGEPKQKVFHETRELQLNAIFAGHYATETFGVRAIGRRLKAGFDIPFDFIDIPTGI